MAKLSQLFDLIKTEDVEDGDVIAAVRDIEGAPEDVAFTVGDLLKGKASLSEEGGVLYPRGVLNGSDSEQTLNWQSTHFTNATLSSVGAGMDLLDLTIASEPSSTAHRAGIGGVAEITFAARRDGGAQAVQSIILPFAVMFRSGGPRVTTGTAAGSAENSNGGSMNASFEIAIANMAGTSGTLRIQMSSTPATTVTNSTLAVTIRCLATWDNPARAISIERAS